ncbi:LysR substrate-binding domain-containing protein [Roseibium sp. RKSG952]|uniref:LysR substrate-binding domain-containing protein n=1 Tax=Roseibium sp. RKSG952 TaxID=2529384 RepID=UPI0018AD2450|nr:LysR substrate-binding domain-containing protein [Roseibium sp. RKSG952]
MQHPNLNRLKTFDAAARHLNFRKAALELHLTPGAVAQQVRTLEAEVGQKLFVRLARGVALTPAGLDFHKELAKGLAQVSDAFRVFERQEPRKVTLSVPPSIASKWLLPRLPGFRAAHPDIELRVEASEALTVFGKDGSDLAIRIGRPPFVGLAHHLLSGMDLVAVGNAAVAKTIPAAPVLSDFLSVPLIFDNHAYWRQCFDAGGLTPPVAELAFNHAGLALDAARSGHGVALVPELIAKHMIETGDLQAFWRTPSPSMSGYYVVYPKTRDGLAPFPRLALDWLLDQERSA